MEMTLGEAFARSARKFPDKIACMDDESSSTYGQMNERVNRWVHAMKGLGWVKGKHVATLSNNCIPLMEIYLGNLKQGTPPSTVCFWMQTGNDPGIPPP